MWIETGNEDYPFVICSPTFRTRWDLATPNRVYRAAPANARLDDLLRSRMTAADWAARQRALDEDMPKLPAAVKAELVTYLESGKDLEEAFPLPEVPIILLTGTKKNPEFPGNSLEQDLKLQLHNEMIAKIRRKGVGRGHQVEDGPA